MIKTRLLYITALFFLLTANGHVTDIKETMACAVANGIQPFCTFNRPEDMVRIPGTHFLIVSETGGVDRKQGHRDLVLFDSKSQEHYLLYPGQSGKMMNKDHEIWGEKHCKPPVWFAPHGIDIVRRPDGRLALFVVNHGNKESVQMFSVVVRDDHVKLDWRGCVNFETGNSLNDVAGLPDGGFVTGSTVRTDETRGIVFHWQPEGGLSRLTTMESDYLNGILASPDGSSVFVNSYYRKTSEVIKISRTTGKIEGTIKTKFYADNNSWSDRGRLLVATIGPRKGLDYIKCDRSEVAYCALPFEIIAIDPETMTSTTIFSHPAGPPFGQATVAVQVGDELYFGSSTGNRIAKIKRPLP